MKTSLCSNLYEWYLDRRYKKVCELEICGVVIQFYWKLLSVQVRKGKVRVSFRRHRNNEELQKEELRSEIREALMLRIKGSK